MKAFGGMDVHTDPPHFLNTTPIDVFTFKLRSIYTQYLLDRRYWGLVLDKVHKTDDLSGTRTRPLSFSQHEVAIPGSNNNNK
jgi:hypothetical protein